MTSSGSAENAGGVFSQNYKQGDEPNPKYNLAVMGLTGAGKSTLVNAVFGSRVAATGVGRPVTRGVKYYQNQSGSLGLYDFEGIETGQDLEAILSRIRTEFDKSLLGHPDDMIHGVWYCVRSSDLRFDESQAKVVRAAAGLDVPVFLILTRVSKRPDKGVDPLVAELAQSIRAEGLPIVTGEPFLVNALADDYNGLAAHGLSELLEVTIRTAPDGLQSALEQAQRLDRKRKRKASHRHIAAAASAAAAVGLTPTPGADSLAIVPIQARLMYKLQSIYELDAPAGTIAAALVSMGATFVGRAAFSALLKLIPGAGNMGAAAVAGSLTWALGAAWDELCFRIWTGDLDSAILNDHEELGRVLLELFRQQVKKTGARRSTAGSEAAS